MNKKVLGFAAVLMLLLASCAPQATPTVSPADIAHTAEAAASTMVAQTQAAVPTSTSVPPTVTALPTLTSIPSPIATGDTIVLPTPTGIPTLVQQQPTAASSGETSTENCNKTLSSWKVPTVDFNIVNETKPQGNVVLSLYVVTEFGECGYLADVTQGPIGTYSAGAFVDGKKDFKVFGGFQINQGSWDIVIRNESITAVGGCYPHC